MPTLMKTLARACPICGGTRGEVLHAQKFELPDGLPLASGYDVVSCERCGFVYADTRVSQRDYDALYAQHSRYQDSQTCTGGGGSPADRARLLETAECIARFLPDRKARLMDIGCANGGLLAALKGLGYTRLYGMDPSPACAAATKAACGAETMVASLSEHSPDWGEFDGVILSHVLEHVQDLGPAVENIRRLTRDGGTAYIEVPDASRYAECLVAPFQDFNTEHINHFSAQCLRSLFQLHGWVRQCGGLKTLTAGPGMPYPAIFGFFVKSEGSRPEVPIEKDAELQGRIQDYIARSRESMAGIESKLRRVLAETPEVIVWGTGQLAMKLLAETCLGQARIAAFVDGSPTNQGKLLRGCRILAPPEVRGLSQPIIVTSILHGHEIARTIREQLKLPNQVVLLTT